MTKSRFWLLLVLAMSIGLSIFYCHNTSMFVRQHDAADHLFYIRYLESFHSLPTLYEGYETYHPPLYYVIGAVWDLTLRSNRIVTDINQDLQALGCLLVILAMVFAFFLLSKPYAMAFAIFALLPGHLLFSSLVNNDNLLIPLGVLLFFAAHKWRVSFQLRWALMGGMICLAGVATKLSFLPASCAFSALILWDLWTSDSEKSLSTVSHFLAATLPWVVFTGSWFIYCHRQTGFWFYTNVIFHPLPQLRVPNTAYRYVWFDLPGFLQQGEGVPFGGLRNGRSMGRVLERQASNNSSQPYFIFHRHKPNLLAGIIRIVVL